MKKNLRNTIGLLLILALIAVAGCGTSNPTSEGSDDAADFTPVVWKMGNQHNSEQTATILDKELVEEIAEATEGRVTIELYTDSSLGDYTSVFDELMLGTVQMAHITGVDSYDARVSCAMIPYLATTYEECEKAYRPDGYLYTQTKEALSALNIRLMGLFPEGFVGIGCQKEVKDPAAVGVEKNALIRVPMLDVFALSTKDLGYRVSSIPYADSYAALQTGVVDGMDGNGLLATYVAFRDVTKYFYDYRHLQEATMIMVNNDAFNALLPQDQEAISNIITAKCKKALEVADGNENLYKEKLTEFGIEVVEFTEEEYAAFVDSCRKNVWPELAKNYPEGFFDNVLADLES